MYDSVFRELLVGRVKLFIFYFVFCVFVWEKAGCGSFRDVLFSLVGVVIF